MNLLEKVNYPIDIKNFSIEELRDLCAEIRNYMIESCSKNPGHLGSSLGAVELIVGLHYVYNTPIDKLVFDVGHQAYAHKILTGRKDLFLKNRMAGGISGFTNRFESEYDAFGAGHTSTSISAALGFALAAKLQNKKEKAIAIIGDGALSGGLAFEGLNNAGNSKADILVIINDNNISIDNNIGAIHEYLLQITTAPIYNKVKRHIWDRLGENKLRKLLQKWTINAKTNIIRESGGALFESMGFRYFGPVAGNDIEQIVDTLQKIKELSGPIILHTRTTKGKGFTPAEEDQTTWHAPGIFDPKTGKRKTKAENDISRYQDVFGEVLLELAKKDSKVVGVTPAMASGCGMNILASEIPERFFDVGIAEQHAVTFSAALAAGGLIPFCNIYSSFSQRAYDQIIHDVAAQNLPVILCFDRGGLVGEDGATHQGNFDIAAYRSIPNCIIATPSDELELKNLMYTAYRHKTGPFIIRYPRGYGEGILWRGEKFEEIEVGKGIEIKKGKDIAIISSGPYLHRAKEAAEIFNKKNGFSPSLYNIRYIKPFDKNLLYEISKNHKYIITIEDGTIKGGLFSEVSEINSKDNLGLNIKGIGIEDKFIEQNTQKGQRGDYNLDTAGILYKLEQTLKETFKKT